jgi:hypothetical protein
MINKYQKSVIALSPILAFQIFLYWNDLNWLRGHLIWMSLGFIVMAVLATRTCKSRNKSSGKKGDKVALG